MHAARPYGSDLRWAGLKRQVPGATVRRCCPAADSPVWWSTGVPPDIRLPDTLHCRVPGLPPGVLISGYDLEFITLWGL